MASPGKLGPSKARGVSTLERPQPPAAPGAGLPECPYRGAEAEEGFPCAAQEGRPVTPEDCRRCPIPAALSHPQACLYLVPLRQADEARFVCRWSFSWAREPAPRDWRQLCFCPYWFPRPPDEAMIPDLAERRAHYLRVLRGERARNPYPAPPAEPEAPPGLWQRFKAWLGRT